MAFLNESTKVLSFSTALIMLLLHYYKDLGGLRVDVGDARDDSDDDMTNVLVEQEGTLDMATITTMTLHTYCLCNLLCFFNEDLGY
jgi:hypothetical protein